MAYRKKRVGHRRGRRGHIAAGTGARSERDHHVAVALAVAVHLPLAWEHRRVKQERAHRRRVVGRQHRRVQVRRKECVRLILVLDHRRDIGESSAPTPEVSIGRCTKRGDPSPGGTIGGCYRPPRSMSNEPDKNGVYGNSTEERCECKTDDDADVNESAYELNETADDGNSDVESSLIRQRLLECASDTECTSDVLPEENGSASLGMLYVCGRVSAYTRCVRSATNSPGERGGGEIRGKEGLDREGVREVGRTLIMVAVGPGAILLGTSPPHLHDEQGCACHAPIAWQASNHQRLSVHRGSR